MGRHKELKQFNSFQYSNFLRIIPQKWCECMKLSPRQSRGDGACKRFSWVLTAFGGLLCFPGSPNDHWEKVSRRVLTVWDKNVKQMLAMSSHVLHYVAAVVSCQSAGWPWMLVSTCANHRSTYSKRT